MVTLDLFSPPTDVGSYMITNSIAPRSSVCNAMVESPLRALDAIWSDVLYWPLDEVDQRNHSFRDSSGFLDLHIDGTHSPQLHTGQIDQASFQFEAHGLLTDLDHGLNLHSKSWTIRFWLKFRDNTSVASLPIITIPNVVNFAASNNLLRPISSITRSGAVATVTCLSAHHLTDTESVVIGTADQTEYNGTFTVTTTSATTFTYAVAGTPATPATGTIKWRRVNATGDPGGDHELRAWIRSHDDVFHFMEPSSVAATGTWFRVILRYDFVSQIFSIQQNDDAPLEVTLPIDFDTYDRFNRFACGGGDLTHDWDLDEVGLWIDYVWSLGEATDDWNSGAGKTWPDVPNVD